MDLNMLIRYGISIGISAFIFFIIITNSSRLKRVVKNRLLIFFLAIVLMLINIILKVILGDESIFYTMIRSIIYLLSISIFVYLILIRNDKK